MRQSVQTPFLPYPKYGIQEPIVFESHKPVYLGYASWRLGPGKLLPACHQWSFWGLPNAGYRYTFHNDQARC